MSTSPAETGPWTVSRLLAWTREFFERRGLESPRLCAEILLAHALGCARLQLYTQHELVPAPDALDQFRATVRAAADGHPIAYLTGRKEFFSLAFEVTPDVLIPRPETEVLVERTIDLVRKSGGTVRTLLDLGTGSGCVAVSLAKHLPEVAVYASDISGASLTVARRNADRHGLAERIVFAVGDLFEPWPLQQDGAPAGAPFDVIVCNPPYVGTAADVPVQDSVRKYEPAEALFAGPDGLDVIRRLVAQAPTRLRPGGYLVLEMAFDHEPALRALLAQACWQEPAFYRDGAGHRRVVQARRPKGHAAHVA
jgi:release factor glutamine methyltransferase